FFPSNANNWLTTSLHNPHNTAKTWYLSTGLPHLNLLNGYLISNNKLSTIVSLDRHSPLDAHPMKQAMIYIPIHLAAGQTAQLVIQYQNPGDIPLALELFDQNSFYRTHNSQSSYDGAILGILVCTLIMVIFQFMLEFRKSYLYLSAFIATGLLHISVVSGQLLLLPLMQQFNPLSWLTVTSHTLPLICFCLFISHSLQLKRHLLSLYHAYMVIVVIASLIIFINLFGEFTFLVLLMSPVLILLMSISIVVLVRKNIPLARLFSVNLALHLLFFVVLFTLKLLQIEPLGHTHMFSFQKLGYVAEAFMFIVILTYRGHLMRKQYQQSLIDRLEANKQQIAAETQKNRIMQQTQRRILDFATSTHDLTQPIAALKMTMSLLSEQVNQPIAQHIAKTIDYTETLLGNIIKTARNEYSEN
ncbi:MAG: hypothetical protein MJK04_15305, partial [Psychrosphaera sp.]|nr:hypothetical protein [Psychrosphaera sp.]